MFGFRFLGKTHVPHCKNTAGSVPVKMLPPKEVLLPVSQHIGSPATITVKVGDEVKVGQLIAEASGNVSASVHSSVSGKVIKIENVLLNDGREVSAVRIENDGLMTVVDNLTPPEVNDLDSLVEAVKASGLVGLGGAGFPTAVKIAGAKSAAVNTIVINAAECEPYITSDTRTMLDKPESIFEGVSVLEKCIPGIEKIVFGIEKNKPECIEEMARIFADNSKVSVLPLPTLYPQGAEKIIAYNTTGRVVPEGKLPVDVGVLVINVTSLAVLGDFVKTGMPLVEKCITVDGSAIKSPKNIIAPIGTRISDVIEFAGRFSSEAGKVLYGGPMMGVAVYSLDAPVLKNTNAIVALAKSEAKNPIESPCIHCGRCVGNCPMGLNPTVFAKAMGLANSADRAERLEIAKVNLCIECGCCSFVCPAKRPLVENNRLAKADLRDYNAKKAKKD